MRNEKKHNHRWVRPAVMQQMTTGNVGKTRAIKVLSLLLLPMFCSCLDKHKGAATTIETASVQTESLDLPVDSVLADVDYFTCASEDEVMKFYSWDTRQGGTSPCYGVICQFFTKNGKSVTEHLGNRELEPAWVSAVHAIKKDDGMTFYITTRGHRISSNEGYRCMDAFMIDHDTLKNVNVLDAGDDLDGDGLVVDYRIADWHFATNGEGWDWLYEYDANERNLYAPLTVYIEETIPVLSDRYRVYHFDGKEFVDCGESAHKGLHESLGNYYRLACYFRTKNYIVRVDWMNEKDSLRYASWSTTLDMSRQPDIVIQGGTYDEEEDTYTFTNGGYEYIVNSCENIPIAGGVSEHHEFLVVRKDGKVMLKEERVNPYDGMNSETIHQRRFGHSSNHFQIGKTSIFNPLTTNVSSSS